MRRDHLVEELRCLQRDSERAGLIVSADSVKKAKEALQEDIDQVLLIKNMLFELRERFNPENLVKLYKLIDELHKDSPECA
jgi:hypothetical protein